ncbi:WXG100 family type VII secretion target [Streptomyces sp. JJ36]|uniref:WXG100 family type VII secretion target n=1 Tax=Streptomyces sp. JJ36 TaxID=2736645 RepID=UPI001F226334|nr:WXG100 family type VII secretion target [Streptomyces sp. JJ36]MCF6523815.1 WXG100 family type VII secretion target [Streptomyces sp. JJ36]
MSYSEHIGVTPPQGEGQPVGDQLKATDKELSDLASDLDDMQEYLQKKIGQLNGIIDRIETGWRSSAARAYTELQRGVNEDAVTIRKNLILIEEAVRMSRDGFSAQDLDTMEHFQRIQDSVAGEQQILGMADGPAEPAAPSSRIADL